MKSTIAAPAPLPDFLTQSQTSSPQPANISQKAVPPQTTTTAVVDSLSSGSKTPPVTPVTTASISPPGSLVHFLKVTCNLSIAFYKI